MSSIKFERIKYIELNKCILDCPIDIKKGALLLDKQNNRVLLQLKLLNITDSKISSVFVNVDSFDDAYDHIQGINTVEHAFLDLALESRKTFGDTNPILMGNNVRNVEVNINKVVFESGEIWRSEGKDIYIKPVQRRLEKLDIDMLDFLKHESQNAGYDFDQILYKPIELDNLWLCSCGRPNDNLNSTCARCNIDKNWVFRYTDEKMQAQSVIEFVSNKKRLIEEAELVRNEELKVQDEARIKENQNSIRIRKRRKSATLISILLLVSLGAFAIFYIKPNQDYQKAIKLNETGDYLDAMKVFEELGDFKDSKKMLLELGMQIEYNAAISNYAAGNYNTAIKQLEKLSGYKDSQEILQKAFFEYAKDLYEKKFFVEAREYFNKVDDTNNTDIYLNSLYYKLEGKWKLKTMTGNSVVDGWESRFTLRENGRLDDKRGINFESKWDDADFQFSSPSSSDSSERVRYKIVKADPRPGGELVLIWLSNGIRNDWELVYDYISN